MCESFPFFDFFELVMLDPNRGIPLKTPQNPSKPRLKPCTMRAVDFSMRTDWI